jgi:hypothetical protein
VATWSFLTNHARALIYIAAHPDTRLREVAAALGVTERTAFVIVADLAEAGHLLKEREGRRNRYHVQVDLPLGDPIARKRTVGELLDLLVDAESVRGVEVGSARGGT